MQNSFYSGVCAVILGWAGASAVGCGGEQVGGSRPTGAVQSDDFASQLAQAFCAGISGCCGTGGFTTDTASCAAALATQIDTQFTTRYASPNIGYDLIAAGRCVDAYRSAASDCYNRKAGDSVNAICIQVFPGKVALGGACTSSEECAQDAARSVNCTTGVCGISGSSTPSLDGPHAKLGEACGSTCETMATGGMTCGGAVNYDPRRSLATCWVDDGLVCGASGSCVAVPSVGQPCADTYQCALGAYCNGTSCVAQSATGSCSGSAYDACVISSYCDSTTYECAPKLPNGAACLSDSVCSGGDCLDGLCRTWSLANANTCSGNLDD